MLKVVEVNALPFHDERFVNVVVTDGRIYASFNWSRKGPHRHFRRSAERALQAQRDLDNSKLKRHLQNIVGEE